MPRKPRASTGRTFRQPEMPPLTDREIEANREISRQLQDLCVLARQRNLDAAVRLSQQAARGRGPLVDWFAEIGRRFGHTLDDPQPEPKLRLVATGEA